MDADTRPKRADGLDAKTRNSLLSFLRAVRGLPNESAKTHRFFALVGELFPSSRVLAQLAEGVEKIVRVQATEGTSSRRRIDAYHGNAIFEFENSLKVSETVALGQLREYAAGIWAEEKGPRRPLLCIAADGLTWQVYRPVVRDKAATKPRPLDVELEHLRTLNLSESTLEEFWLWLTSVLFGGQRQNPTASRIKNDFGAASPAFADAMGGLREAWEVVGGLPEQKLAFETWHRYLAVTYGQLGGEHTRELEELFLKHTYLATTARFLVWGALSHGKHEGSLREEAKTVMSGEYFQRQGIENLAENDFFQWARRREAERVLAPVWERMLAQVLSYSLEKLDEDVLRGVYQELIDPEDRHELGEYYTPEWLCERVVQELLPDSGWVSVLDPTCGSGSFLRAAIAHLLAKNPDEPGKLRAVLENVVGIDIHPLAVIIARATYVLAISQLIRLAKRPVQIPVFLADSLFLPTEVTQLRLGEIPGYEIRFGVDRAVSIPEELVRDPELFDPAVAAAAKVATDHAAGGKETEKTLQAYLRRSVPSLSERADFQLMAEALWRFTSELADLIRKRRNSIWAFVIRNAYRPAMLRERFDFIVGNPPWLSYRFIADPAYQAEVKQRALTDYAVAPKAGKLFTQMELAIVFLAHAIATFGNRTSRLGFIMPRSVLYGDQHETLRLRTYRAPFLLDAYWDLLHVEPVFSVPACVLFAQRTSERIPPETSYSIPAVEWSGRLPSRDMTWKAAAPHLARTDKRARLIFLGSRNALSTAPGKTKPNRPSPYLKLFHQGATIVPRSFYFVAGEGLEGTAEADRLYALHTDPLQAKEAKKPYKDIRMQGQVEGLFLFRTALSKHILPFRLTDTVTIVLPALVKDGKLKLLKPDELRKQGFREAAGWMDEVQRVWARKRGEKATLQDAYQALDYNGKLTSQDISSRHLVVYNHSGANVSATRIDRRDFDSRFIVDVKLYGAECRSSEEALYLTAILNSETVNHAIKPFQSMGLFGERDIHKKLLELPIPAFNFKHPVHQELVRLASEAEREASDPQGYPQPREEGGPTKSLGRRRAIVRDALSSTLHRIDASVQALLEATEEG